MIKGKLWPFFFWWLCLKLGHSHPENRPFCFPPLFVHTQFFSLWNQSNHIFLHMSVFCVFHWFRTKLQNVQCRYLCPNPIQNKHFHQKWSARQIRKKTLRTSPRGLRFCFFAVRPPPSSQNVVSRTSRLYQNTGNSPYKSDIRSQPGRTVLGPIFGLSVGGRGGDGRTVYFRICFKLHFAEIVCFLLHLGTNIDLERSET